MKKPNKKTVISFVAYLAGVVATAAFATAIGEEAGFACLFAYIYGRVGHKYVSGFLEKKVK